MNSKETSGGSESIITQEELSNVLSSYHNQDLPISDFKLKPLKKSWEIGSKIYLVEDIELEGNPNKFPEEVIIKQWGSQFQSSITRDIQFVQRLGVNHPKWIANFKCREERLVNRLISGEALYKKDTDSETPVSVVCYNGETTKFDRDGKLFFEYGGEDHEKKLLNLLYQIDLEKEYDQYLDKTKKILSGGLEALTILHKSMHKYIKNPTYRRGALRRFRGINIHHSKNDYKENLTKYLSIIIKERANNHVREELNRIRRVWREDFGEEFRNIEEFDGMRTDNLAEEKVDESVIELIKGNFGKPIEILSNYFSGEKYGSEEFLTIIHNDAYPQNLLGPKGEFSRLCDLENVSEGISPMDISKYLINDSVRLDIKDLEKIIYENYLENNNELEKQGYKGYDISDQRHFVGAVLASSVFNILKSTAYIKKLKANFPGNYESLMNQPTYAEAKSRGIELRDDRYNLTRLKEIIETLSEENYNMPKEVTGAIKKFGDTFYRIIGTE